MANEWEDAPSDWEDAPSEDEGFFKKALGVGEGALSVGTGLLSAIPAGVAGIGSLVTGGGLEGANKTLENVSEAMTYEPRTKTGKKTAESVNKTLADYQEEYARKFAADAEYLTKQKKNPNASDLAAENTELAVGQVLSGLYVPGLRAPGRRAGKVDPIVEEVKRRQAEIDAAKEVAKKPDVWEDAPTNETRQLDLLEPDNQGKAANPYEAQHGTWAVDENGMPVRTDISMEAANLEQPLQRNLWGDELAPRETPRGQAEGLPMDRDIMGYPKMTPAEVAPEQIGITQAMDNTRRRAQEATELPEAVAAREEMQSQIDRLSHDIKDIPAEMDRALMEAEIMTPRSEFTDPNVPKGVNKNAAKFEEPKQLTGETPKVEPKPVDEATIQKVVEKTVAEQAKPSSTGFVEAFAGLKGGGTTADIYNKAFDALKQGKDTIAGVRDPLISRHKSAFEEGRIKSPEDLRAAEEGRIKVKGLGQRGAVGNLTGKGKRKRTIIDDIKERYGKEPIPDHERKNLIPDNPDPKKVVEDAKAEGKDSKAWNMTESGATLAALKRGSALIQGVARIIQNAGKRADLAIREIVFPTEKALRSLSREEIASLSDIMKMEMLQGKRFDPSALSHLSVKQQVAYAHLRHMFEDTLRIQNEARAAKGQKPITELEAYMSSRWSGDFRRPVYQAVLNKDGSPKIKEDGTIERKLVWYLAAHSKHGLEKQWKALKKEHPDLTFDPKDDHVVRYYKRQTDLQSQLTTIVDILGRDDPAVDKIRLAVMEQSVNEAATFLGQEKHFKEKTGVRGFVGDRPGKTGAKEAIALFQQQIQYAKNAYKWAEIQKAGQDLKTILSDPDLAKQQPNNMKYAKEYVKQNIGYGEATAIAHLEDSVRNLGFSPTVINEAVGNMKSFFILQKLAVNSGYTIANILQTSNVLPHLGVLWGQGYKGNPLTAIPVGITGGIAMALGHYANFLGGGKLAASMRGPEANFLQKAFRYAEDNGVTARALYDESPIESSFSTVGRTANALGRTMSVSEAFVRGMSYMTFVEYLRSSGKFKGNDLGLFQKAEEMVNASMVDYRRGERPMMFEKLGTTGNFLNTLQTYPVNWYNQWNLFGREAMKGNVAPFLAALAVQYSVAGAMGIPGFEDMTKMWDLIKDNMIGTTTYAKYRDNDFFTDPKMWMVNNLGQASVYGWLSDKSGIGLTSRVSAPGAGQMLQSPAGPIVDIAGQAGNVASAALDPSNRDKWAQVAMSSSPPGLQGLVETNPLMEGTTWDTRVNPQTGQKERIYGRPGNVESHTGIVTRTPKEETLRKFGLRSQKETVERELGYRYDKNKRVAEEKAKSIPDAMYAAAKRGDQEKVKDLYAAYVKLTGNEISQEAWEAQVKQNYMTTVERANTAAKSVTALQDVARMNKILKDIKDEYQRRGQK